MSHISNAASDAGDDARAMEIDGWNCLYKATNDPATTMTLAHARAWANLVEHGNNRLLIFPIGPTNGEAVGSKLLSQVMKSTLPGTFPKVSPYFDARGVLIQRVGDLLEKPEGGYRYDGAEFIIFGAPYSFWPPPLNWEGEGGSVTYEFTAKDFGIVKAEAWLADNHGASNVALYRQVNKDGQWLTNKYIMRTTNAVDNGKNLTYDGVTLRPVYRCSFCWRGTPFAEPHTASKCPLVSTMNKARKAAGYPPIGISDTTRPTIPKEKAPIDVNKELGGLKDSVAKLTTRVDKLEKSLGDKGKDKGGQQQQGKKRKADAPPATENKDKKAKKGKGAKGGKKGQNKGKEVAK